MAANLLPFFSLGGLRQGMTMAAQRRYEGTITTIIGLLVTEKLLVRRAIEVP